MVNYDTYHTVDSKFVPGKFCNLGERLNLPHSDRWLMATLEGKCDRMKQRTDSCPVMLD